MLSFSQQQKELILLLHYFAFVKVFYNRPLNQAQCCIINALNSLKRVKPDFHYDVRVRASDVRKRSKHFMIDNLF
jgi:hypothetical protein